MKLKYNLQFFGEKNDDTDPDNSNDAGTDGSSNSVENNEIDVQAFADIISEKDKQIEQLQKDVAELKKSNANLLVKVNSSAEQNTKKSFEENLLSMVGAKPRKE